MAAKHTIVITLRENKKGRLDAEIKHEPDLESIGDDATCRGNLAYIAYMLAKNAENALLALKESMNKS